MGSSLMANSAKNSVGQFHRIIARIEFAGLLPVPNNLRTNSKLRRRLAESMESGGISSGAANTWQNQSDKALMILRECEDSASDFDEPLFRTSFASPPLPASAGMIRRKQDQGWPETGELCS
jgi:hypothetical protein